MTIKKVSKRVSTTCKCKSSANTYGCIGRTGYREQKERLVYPAFLFRVGYYSIVIA